MWTWLALQKSELMDIRNYFEPSKLGYTITKLHYLGWNDGILPFISSIRELKNYFWKKWPC